MHYALLQALLTVPMGCGIFLDMNKGLQDLSSVLIFTNILSLLLYISYIGYYKIFHDTSFLTNVLSLLLFISYIGYYKIFHETSFVLASSTGVS